MRSFALLLTTLLCLSAGCTEDGAGPTPTEEPAMAEPLPRLPANFTHEVDVTAGVDIYNFILVPTPVGGGGPCSSDLSSCSKFPFTLNRTANITATLDWTMDGYDLDFYLMHDGVDVSEGVGASGATTATIAPHEEFAISGLDEGEYEIWVSHWFVPRDTYVLTVEFT